MESIKSYEYSVTGIPSCCVSPVIQWIAQPGVLISCSGTTVTASFPEDYSSKRCLTLFITCNSCGTDQVIERTVCFCNGTDNCGPCEDCINGICVPRCSGICNEATNTCVDCDPTHPCPGNKVCVAGGCQCATSKPYDVGGNRCVECLGQNDCELKYGKCYKCVDGTCVFKGDCGGTGVCDPDTGGCEECLTAGDCLVQNGDQARENFCCVNKKCVCCPGFVLDQFGNCVPGPQCKGDDCGPCGQCIQGRCVPRQCPDGQVCVNGDCLEKCDCNNPASCTNQGKICKTIDGQCVCIPCGNCSNGCANGCHCIGNDICVVDKCHGDCTNGAGCSGGGSGTGCGCLDNTCVDCAQLKCATGECAQALGCECTAQGDCVSTASRCIGGCDTYKDCGPNCTCYNNQCVPCEFFSCETGDCAEQEGCKCNASKCEGDKDLKCTDILDIVKIEATCDLQGELTKERDCSCPVITTLLKGVVTGSSGPLGVAPHKTSGTHTLSFGAKLFLGNTQDPAFLLDNIANPDISINETASAGSLKLDVITNFQPINGTTPTPITQTLLGSIAGKGTVPMGSVTIYQMNGYPISTGNLNENRVVSSVTFRLRAESWAFPNTCTYGNKQIGSYQVNINSGFSAVSISDIVTSTDTRDPKFIWYKSVSGVFDASTWIRTAYVPLASGGKYIDLLHDEVVNGIKYVESCNHYGLKTDCSCQPIKSKYIVFCKPPDFIADIDPNSCGRTVSIVVGKTCHANKNKTFEVAVNGSVKFSGKLFDSGFSGTFTDAAGIKTVTFYMLCNGKKECLVTKTFNPPVPPNVIPDAVCAGDTGDGVKVTYTFNKGQYSQTLEWVKVTDDKTHLQVSGVDNGSTITYTLPPYDSDAGTGSYSFVAHFTCGDVTGSLKKNCCELYAPILTGTCKLNNRAWTNLFTAVTYHVSGAIAGTAIYTISKLDLGRLTPDKAFTFTPVGTSTPVTLQPAQMNKITWSKSGCKGDNAFAPICGKFTAIVTKVGVVNTMVITEGNIAPPSKPGDVYQLKVNGGLTTTYTPGTVFTGIYGVNTVVINKNGEPLTLTLEIRAAANCDIKDSDITLTQVGQTYQLGIPAVQCKSPDVLPLLLSIKRATRMGSLFRIEFYSLFRETPSLLPFFEIGANTEPFIKSGTLTVHTPTSSQTIIVSNTSDIAGYIDVPAVQGLNDVLNLSYSLDRLYIGAAPYPDNNSTLKMCLKWPASLGTSISSVQLTNLTNSQVVNGVISSDICWNFSGVNLTGGARIKFGFVLNDSTTFEVEAIEVQYPTGDDHPFVYGDNEVIYNDCLGFVEFEFSGTLVNGAHYSSTFTIDELKPTVCDGDQEFLREIKAVLDPAISVVKAKVNFYEDGAFIKRQYISGGYDKAYLDGTQPANPDGIEFGKTYTADVTCLCTANATIGCFKPVITTATTACMAGYYSDGSSKLKLTYTLTTAYPTTSVILYNSSDVVVDNFVTDGEGNISSRQVSLTESQAGLNDDIVLYAVLDGGCTSANKTAVRSEVLLTWTRDCTNSPTTYDLIFANSPTLTIVSGTGTVSGSSIINIPNATTITFTGAISGCTSKQYSDNVDCTIAPSPSLSRTASRTTSVTKSVSMTRSVSNAADGGGIIVYSVPVSRTPSVTRSISLSESVSSSIGASSSVTASITVSKSASTSLNASISNTPTITVSISVTRSVTVSQSFSASASVSVSPVAVAPICDSINTALSGGNVDINQSFVSNGSGTLNIYFTPQYAPDQFIFSKNSVVQYDSGCVTVNSSGVNAATFGCPEAWYYQPTGAVTPIGSSNPENPFGVICWKYVMPVATNDVVNIQINGGCTDCPFLDGSTAWGVNATCSF